MLNQALWNVLQRIAEPLAKAKGLPIAEVQPTVALLFSQMIGALVLQIAGRLDHWQVDSSGLLQLLLAQLWGLAASATAAAAPFQNAKRANPKPKIGRT
jgi:hypothetical protein